MNEPADSPGFGATIRGLTSGQEVFGRYRLQEILGRGDRSVVWCAHDRELDREVAVKFLPDILTHDRGAIDELKRETRRALALTHPHIVRIYDFVSEGEMAAIMMEFAAGQTLAQLRLDLPDKVMGVAELAPIVAQLCEALDYAHTKARMVHRDLKPANLMLTARGELKITEFGIAAALLDATTRVSRVLTAAGTPEYMSPQQMLGEPPAETDDIYSLGATLYELLTGKPPFYSGDVYAQVQGKFPPAVSVRRAEFGMGVSDGRILEPVPAAWERTIAACLAKSPADRPQHVTEVAAGLGLRPALPGLGSVPGVTVPSDLNMSSRVRRAPAAEAPPAVGGRFR